MPITHEWNGTILTITSDSGTSSCDLRGEKGDDGARGITTVITECVAEDSKQLGGVAAKEYATKDYVSANTAPAGYGYGGVVVSANTTTTTTEAELDAVLKTMLSGMSNGEAKQIKFTCSVLPDWGFCGTLFKTGTYYASLVAYAEYKDAVIGMSKAYYYGVWQPWEWENPPMVLGTEYRTTERYNGKAVYAMCIDCGTLPNTSSKSISTTIPANANVIYTRGIAVGSGGGAEAMPCIAYNGAITCAYFLTNNKNININTFTDMTGYNGNITVKYTKD